MKENVAERGNEAGGELVVLGLGSNTGNSAAILRGAVIALSAILSRLHVSSLYITAPQDYEAQPDFCNAAVAGYFAFSPEELLFIANSIEADFGRDRTAETHKGPRSLDIDILLFGERIVSMEKPCLTIPHKAMKQRRFALVPLVEICPGAIDPLTGAFYSDILAGLPDQRVQKLEGFLWN